MQSYRPRAPQASPRAPAAELFAITAPSEGPAEVAALEQLGDLPTAVLRRAHLRSAQGDHRGAIELLDSILFGRRSAGNREIQALARFLRSRAFDATNDPERASYDRKLALELTEDRDLRQRLVAIPDRPVTGQRRAFPVLARSAWKAQSPRASNMTRMGRVSRITVHHSASSIGSPSKSRAATTVRGIQMYHQRELGWGDIGYHFLIDTGGRVWQGRDIAWQGAHAGDNRRNQGNVGICLLGNFVPRGQGAPPKAQIQAMSRLVAELATRYSVPPKRILTHRELKATECPGPYIHSAVAQLRSHLNSNLAEEE